MQAILAVTFPFFALVLLGYLAVLRGYLPESAIPGLNGFVLFFALPCMLFRFGASMPMGGNSVTLTFSATVEGSSMKGTMSAAGFSGEFTGTKAGPSGE